jgi:serine/arginine repetitive matrix protein 1
MSNPPYIGISSSQDGRFSNKEEKYKKETRFPKIFDHKVDLKKINVKYIKEWIDRKGLFS